MISHQELERRHTAMRSAMQATGYEALIITGDVWAGHKGYVRYAADWSITDGLVWLVFPLDSEPAMVMNFGSQAYWAGQRAMVRVVRPALDKTAEVVAILKERGLANASLGIVGLDDIIPYRQGKTLFDALPGAHFDDATAMMQDLLIPSTAGEIAMAEETHNIAAQALKYIETELAPGKSEREVMSGATHLMERLGCTHSVARLSTTDPGSNRPASDRTFEPDDIVRIYQEMVGPSGYWAELGGVFSFREPTEPRRRKFNTVVKAMGAAARLMCPGTVAEELCAVIEQTYRDDGFKIVGRSIWDVHGQGLNGHLPPNAWPGSKEVLKANMILNMHPGVVTEDRWGFGVNSNYVVTPEGGRSLGGFQHMWHVLAR